MPRCAAYNCKNRTGSCESVTFHAFPLKDPLRLKEWLVKMKWDNWTPSRFHLLCSNHFEEKYIDRTGLHVRLTKTAVPTIFSFPDHMQKKKKLINPKSRRYLQSVPVVPVDVQPSAAPASITVRATLPKTDEPNRTTQASAGPSKRGIDWSIQVDADLQKTESFPSFFHNYYCLPQSILWAGEQVQDVTCENSEICQQIFPLKHIIEVKERWEWLGLDIRGPLSLTLNGHKFVVTVTDYYSKWVEAYPLKTRTADEVATHLREIFTHFGFPLGVLSRLSKGFVKKMNSTLRNQLKLEGVSLVTLHRQTGTLAGITQALIDRMVSDLVKEHPGNWDVFLPAKVFSLCCREHPSTKRRPISLLHCKGPPLASTPRDIPFSSAQIHKSSFVIRSNRTDILATDCLGSQSMEPEDETGGGSPVTMVSFVSSL